MKKRTIAIKVQLIAVILILLSSCSTNEPSQFVLKGQISNFEDGTMLYLKGHEILDSTFSYNGEFRFDTKLDSTPIQLNLFTKNFEQYRHFWAIDSLMTFKSKNGAFETAEITGSELERMSEELRNETQAIRENYPDRIISEKKNIAKDTDFIENHPNHFLATYYLDGYSKTFGREKTERLYKKLSNEMKRSLLGKRIKSYLELVSDVSVGKKYVDFAMKDDTGNMRRLSDLTSNYTLLEFWASWCAPCRKENPNLVKTYEKYHPMGFEIVAVSTDSGENRWKKAIETDQLPWIHLNDLKGEDNLAKTIYSVHEIPSNFLIDSTGTIVAKNLRGDALNDVLDKLF